MKLLRMVMLMSVLMAWYFVTVDTNAKRHEFGPYKTQRDCNDARNYEALKQIWVILSECEKG